VNIPLPVHGRGATVSPTNRFERLAFEPDGDAFDDAARDERPHPATVFLRDSSRSIIATNDSPDVSFDVSINPYRGCEHGCAYCFARPTHEYLGFNAGLDFETRIMVKLDAAKLLRAELASPRWQPKMLAVSGVTDCYQPAERHFRLTRQCLEVLAECRNPVGIVTKNHLVTRDADLLSDLARHDAAAVFVSLTTLDPHLAAKLEPRASSPRRRLDAVAKLAAAGVPVGVLTAPVIPGLNDVEVPALLAAAADAGATHAGYVPLRLPLAVAPVFEGWLREHYLDRADKVLNQVRSMRGGQLYNSAWNTRMRGTGHLSDQFEQLFHLARKRAGMGEKSLKLSTAHFRRPQTGGQMGLFD